jgi:hypothetical protein
MRSCRSLFASLRFAVPFFVLLISGGSVFAQAPTPSCNSYYQCVNTAAQQEQACVMKILASRPRNAIGTPNTSACATTYSNTVQMCRSKFSCPPAIMRPNYLVLSLLYAPPGNSSSAGFSQGQSQGVTTSISNSFAAGDSINFSASGGFIGQGTLGVSFGMSNSSQDSQGFQVTTSSTQGSQIKSTSDAADHTQDRFFLWLNPQVTVTQTGLNTGTYTVGPPPGQPMDIIDVNIHELQNPSLIPSAKMGPQIIHGLSLPGLAGLTATDFSTILSLDPFVSTDPTLPPADTKRFVYVDSQYLEGPDYKLASGSADPNSNSFNESDAQVATQTQSESLSYNVGFSTGAKVDLAIFGGSSLDVKTSLTWTQSTSFGTSSGTTHQASVTLGSQTPQVDCWIDIYEDTLYHTFLFVPPRNVCNPPPSTSGGAKLLMPSYALTGTVTNTTGQPVAQQLVIVRFAQGGFRRLHTNAHGNYVVYSAPAGPAQVTVGTAVQNPTIAAGNTAVANFVVQ